VTLVDTFAQFGDIPVGDSTQSSPDYSFVLDSDCPDGQSIQFNLFVTDSTGNEWSSYFNETAKAPSLFFLVYSVDDDGSGNGDGVVDPDETADLDLTLRNEGLADAWGVSGILTTSDSYVDVNTGSADFSLVPAGGVGSSATPFQVYVHSDCPIPHYADMVLDLEGDLGYAAADTFTLKIATSGYSWDVESTAGWTHESGTGGYEDEWHWSTERSHSSSHSWKCGTVGGDYSNYLDACLMTPEFDLEENSQLTFFHWLEAETSGINPGYCYDGGIVQIQIDGGDWETLTPDDGYPYIVMSGYGHPFQGSPAYSSNYSYWRQADVDLSGYSGQARLRFRFGTDQGIGMEGWYVDDVSIGRGDQPDIDLDPWWFEFTLPSDDSTSSILEVWNVGTLDLAYTVQVQSDSALLSGVKVEGPELRSDWLDVQPGSGSVTPGAHDELDVLVDATGLEEGTYYVQIQVDSDDPDESWLIVPVELEVLSGVCGDANGDQSVTPGDGYMVLNYLGAGPEPASCWAANVNGDGSITPGDGFHLLNYLGTGPELTCAPCEFSVRPGIPVRKIRTEGPGNVR
jgi:hypothetical protein